MTIEEDIKGALARGAVIIGAREVLRAIKIGQAKQVVLSSNAPGNLTRDVTHYTKLAKVTVTTFGGTGSQLGTFLGKPFGVSALAIKAEGKK
jgi:ribosomal protein L30E